MQSMQLCGALCSVHSLSDATACNCNVFDFDATSLENDKSHDASKASKSFNVVGKDLTGASAVQLWNCSSCYACHGASAASQPKSLRSSICGCWANDLGDAPPSSAWQSCKPANTQSRTAGGAKVWRAPDCASATAPNVTASGTAAWSSARQRSLDHRDSHPAIENAKTWPWNENYWGYCFDLNVELKSAFAWMHQPVAVTEKGQQSSMSSRPCFAQLKLLAFRSFAATLPTANPSRNCLQQRW